MSDRQTERDPIPAKTLIVPCRTLKPGASLAWLVAGWADLKQAKRISLIYGLLIYGLTAAVAWFAWKLGGYVLLIAVLSGFVFVAPVLAFGLYSVSRQLYEGNRPQLRSTIRAIRRPIGNGMVYTLVLLMVFLLWARAGMMVQVFFPLGGKADIAHILTFLLIGSAVGSIFAAFSFSASVFSLPMLANRDVDVITAVVSSINAVLRNKPAMFIWAVVICTLTMIGFMTAGIGLIVIVPWLAYATWHGYRATLDVSDWSILPRE